MTELESKTQRKVIDIVRKYDGYIYKNAQSMYTEKGRPDLTACIPVSLSKLIEIFGANAKIGIFVGIEMKRPGALNNVSEAQEIVGRKIKNAKGLWFAIDDPAIIEALMLKFVGDDNAIQ